ncbi:MAG: hypothetical protein COZ75_00520 [Flavobacteriaceae bacterium CG_4_8_14_3_um_filter_34_10]|nr:MAG: hypothetical protein AUK33_08795 [Flavobacteriaceae bacterium CG2_30_34_30]PIQ17218.1 MAG: hypothetical protein COW66_12705 [Flavobacteriaceae bacterium CG18_big_fil_WC_8_21_14_2_50_34_36]PIV48625.1 MAG: hypothetical protein COS19_12810 [Flavobacteriaceae bacterium CG02_land_8_20_14_3_00_34_13]PIX10653.1 MAG: hypothetical protein COZ75_00520 [Flavobacteriaceae bacterium CG_4_8_14_3_um_filter_34_10]PIZ08181.1 MAG: hypothetical protein COY56_05185 [Flavobacteriaceae bacterium CG_4_10_14_0
MYQIFNDISFEDILYVLNNPWFLSESEWALQDNKGIKNAFDFAVNKLKLCDIDGLSKIWKTADGQPIAILGFYVIGIKKYETFFLASKLMDNHALKISFDLRKILKDEMANYLGCTCIIYSTSNHPKQMTWFKFLGFTYVPERNKGAARYFELASR